MLLIETNGPDDDARRPFVCGPAAPILNRDRLTTPRRPMQTELMVVSTAKGQHLGGIITHRDSDSKCIEPILAVTGIAHRGIDAEHPVFIKRYFEDEFEGRVLVDQHGCHLPVADCAVREFEHRLT
jgi:hypothetical protein